METISNQFSLEETKRNHQIFLERTALFKRYGFDQEDARMNIIRQISGNSRSILEIGTGKGHLTTLLARSFGRVVSVDNNNSDNRAAMLKAAYYEQQDKIEFITADAAKLDYPDRSFDAVVSAFTFHHLELPFKVIKEMVRIADRQIVISDFNNKGFDIVDRIHASEERVHDRQPGDFDIVGVFLKEFNFDVKVIEDECQTIYSAIRKN
jgi:ubiquinone/menaquinone biosynthesis C-methylase UbiE